MLGASRAVLGAAREASRLLGGDVALMDAALRTVSIADFAIGG